MSKFLNMIEKAPQSYRDLFEKLISNSEEVGIQQVSTETPDYRFRDKSGVNFCLVKVNSFGVKLHIRRDLHSLETELNIRPLSEGRYHGSNWGEIVIRNESDLSRAFDYIKRLYWVCT